MHAELRLRSLHDGVLKSCQREKLLCHAASSERCGHGPRPLPPQVDGIETREHIVHFQDPSRFRALYESMVMIQRTELQVTDLYITGLDTSIQRSA